ncbi:hypothetical protein CC85DRAFT_42639 [Cutaneotrichosporon oleaginosum]|uniref:Uncharacterized protein n=1 Tax=Cutaneotrichosporon oleaginosum TaxID=879819 RepID=A0A0J0XRG0_9TREE|nr:uncharacterized protein CC85DRAFT_42639 [Cutaneotrichosporon oleaginosum]KLT43726.1 hypothetical protein CC85DRAFT_42639 [Cutaneotrichosporon oleaginosum]TXT05144.1 hypothetical protein COLE_06464 [Cutaneotrichosporon oleaginosum]
MPTLLHVPRWEVIEQGMYEICGRGDRRSTSPHRPRLRTAERHCDVLARFGPVMQPSLTVSACSLVSIAAGSSAWLTAGAAASGGASDNSEGHQVGPSCRCSASAVVLVGDRPPTELM